MEKLEKIIEGLLKRIASCKSGDIEAVYKKSKMVSCKQAKEYALVYLERQSPSFSETWVQESDLYIVHEPSSSIKNIGNVDYGANPVIRDKTYTNFELEELEDGVIVQYDCKLQLVDSDTVEIKSACRRCEREGHRKRKFQWISTQKQGNENPEFKIIEV
jgi:hypothetical protein